MDYDLITSKQWLLCLIILAILSLSACSQAPQRLVLATTTSTVDSGLLDNIIGDFEQSSHIEVDLVAVGTGEAIRLGEAGDVDVILVHARSREDAFVADGYGVERHDVMCNDFVILGPSADPAAVRGEPDVTTALQSIASSETLFISRGDNSGTHIREQALWAAAELAPAGDWYLNVGQGMGATLSIANEQLGYTISDRGTYIKRSVNDNFALEVLVERDSRLMNPYGVIAINPDRHNGINHNGANAFIEWLLSAETQQAIADYRVNGQQLFMTDPAACGK